MLVVSDTSPLTALLQIGRADILPAVFGRVLIPPAVEAELLRFHLSLPVYFETRPLKNPNRAQALPGNLDVGEAEAIILAEECAADYILIDEKKGRAVAEERGLRVTGLLGVLRICKEAGVLPAVRPVLDELENHVRFFVSDAVKNIVLRAVGEI